MDNWTYAWLAWLAAFAVIEGAALFNKKDGDTLSEHVWKWFATSKKAHAKEGTEQPKGTVRIRRFALLAGMAWLTVHFLTGGRW